MNIKTRFQTGDTVWFYDSGKACKAKIEHIQIDINGGERIDYRLDRKDKEYKHYWESNRYLYAHLYGANKIPPCNFYEEDLGSSLDELKMILRTKEKARHFEELEKIMDL